MATTTTVHSLMVTLPQMVDLALGSPEIGAVNFNILNAVLHVLIQQSQLTSHLVEYRGPNKELIANYMQTAVPGGSLKISEVYSEKDSKKVKHDQQKLILVEHTDKKAKQHAPQVMVGITQNYLKQIEENVEDLRSKMEEIMGLPTNETIVEAIRNSGNDSTKPVYDMWQALKIAKRVDAMELALSKLTSITEDIIQDAVTIDIKPKSGSSSKKSINSSRVSGEHSTRLKAGGDDSIKDGTRSPGGSVEPKRRSSSFFKHFMSEITARLDVIEERLSTLENKEEGEPADLDTAAILKEITTLKKQIKAFNEEIGSISKGSEGKSLGDILALIAEMKIKVFSKEEENTGADIEEKFSNYNDKLNNLDESLSSQIGKLQTLYIELENELNMAREMIAAKDDAVDEMSLSEIYNKMLKLQEDMEGCNRTSANLKDELFEKQRTMDILVEQIEVLKTAKADREDLEDALADKADAQQVNRKVSVNQFDATCDDITRNIEIAMEKLHQQEEAWRSTLEELGNRLGMKLDKGEFDPLKEFVNKKIKSLQDRVKELIAMRQEQEAAGTKHKLLKDVNCISCDKNVVMQRENQFLALPTPAPLLAHRSMKPYITYELDAVRKQQKALPGSRNMNHLETALQDKIPTKEKATPREKQYPPGHLCNRYCGGSHTMTVPQQRVAHVGHFLQQWGPHAVALDDGQIMGNDGQMYKSRDPPPKPKEPIVPSKERSKLSACIQTEEDVGVPRMSEGLLKVAKPEGEKKRASITLKSTDGEKRKSGSRVSLGGSSKKKRGSSSKTDGRRESTDKRDSKKGSVSLKRLSQQKDLSGFDQDNPPRGAAHLDDEFKIEETTEGSPPAAETEGAAEAPIPSAEEETAPAEGSIPEAEPSEAPAEAPEA